MELLLIDFGHVLKTIYAETDKKTLQPVRYLYVYERGQLVYGELFTDTLSTKFYGRTRPVHLKLHLVLSIDSEICPSFRVLGEPQIL